MSQKKAKEVTIFGIIANTFLFIIKLSAGIISNSLAIISDALNSFTDIITSIAIFIAVNVSHKRADQDHPFGHRRAEPIAGLLVAIMAAILGFEILKRAITIIIKGNEVIFVNKLVISIVATSIIVKIIMAFYQRWVASKINSPAISASYIDSRNDILVSSLVLIGIIIAKFSNSLLDPIIAILIGVYILFSGYKIGIRNIEYLMGKSPGKEMIEKIGETALAIPGVKGVNEINAHYVGNFIHVEVHIDVNKRLNTKKSHKIGKHVQFQLESMEHINKAFVHIDPV